MNGGDTGEQSSLRMWRTKTTLIIVVVAVVFIAAVALAWRFFIARPEPAPTDMAESDGDIVVPEEQGLGGELLEEAQGSAARVPQINPVTNPLKDVYENPFE